MVLLLDTPPLELLEFVLALELSELLLELSVLLSLEPPELGELLLSVLAEEPEIEGELDSLELELPELGELLLSLDPRELDDSLLCEVTPLRLDDSLLDDPLDGLLLDSLDALDVLHDELLDDGCEELLDDSLDEDSVDLLELDELDSLELLGVDSLEELSTAKSEVPAMTSNRTLTLFEAAPDTRRRKYTPPLFNVNAGSCRVSFCGHVSDRITVPAGFVGL